MDAVPRRKDTAQADRNRRMKPADKRQRRRIRRQALAVFVCDQCRREVVIPWRSLGADTPRCRQCNSPLVLVTACLNKGVLPRSG